VKLYIKAVSSYRSDVDNVDIKQALKTQYKMDTRRKDAFMLLAIFGAKKLNDNVVMNANDELYITSGVGNIGIVKKTYISVIKENECMMPFDFLNMLGNTTSYYVADSLGIKGKNSFQISNSFTFFNTLVSIYASLYASLKSSKNDAILGSVDINIEPQEILQRVLGVVQETELCNSVNYQKLSLNPHNAIASVEFEPISYSENEIEQLKKTTNTKIVISDRVAKNNSYSFENMASFAINNAILNQEDIVYIELFQGRYKVLRVNMI